MAEPTGKKDPNKIGERGPTASREGGPRGGEGRVGARQDGKSAQQAGGGYGRSLTDYNVTVSYGAKVRGGGRVNTSIIQGNGADWFGPLDPMSPSAPPEVAGRRFDYPSGYNLLQQPRVYEIGFPELRSMADGYDLLRIIIEKRKDQMARQTWSVVPRNDKVKLQGEMLERALAIEAFFERPDKQNFWEDWLRTLLEDLIVIDAPTLYRRRTRGGDLYALEPVDGATIKRVIDDWGRTPEWPAPAYQQCLKGLPAVDYTVQDLIYRPMNIRTNKVYGYSPVEQLLLTINTGLRREIWQLQYFTDGNIPDSLIGVPSTWTPDQIRGFQDWFDSTLQGNTGERRKARFVPGEVAKSYVPTKDAQIFGEAEEWLARMVCYALREDPTPFVKQNNRATAESAQEDAVSSGLYPLMRWTASMISTIIAEDFKSPDLKFAWTTEEEVDPEKQSKIHELYLKGGVISRNEVRKALGKDPDPDPAFNKPMVLTSTGYVDGSAAPADGANPTLAGFQPKKSPDGTLVGFQNQANEEANASVDENERNAAEQARSEEAVRQAQNPENSPKAGDTERGAENEGDVAQDGTGGTKEGERENEDLQVADEEDQQPAPGQVAEQTGEQSEGDKEIEDEKRRGGKQLTKFVPAPIEAERAMTRTARKSMRDTWTTALAVTGVSVGEQFKDVVAATKTAVVMMRKIDEDDGDDFERWVNAAYEAMLAFVDVMDLSKMFSTITDDTDDLFDVAGDSAMRALAQVGVDNSKLVNQVNERALAFADKRAAEMVGMRRTADGKLIANPNAKWAITSSTRDMVRKTIESGIAENIGTDAIIKNIVSSHAFDGDRAGIIARTEIARANSEGQLNGYRDAIKLGIDIKKMWVTVDDDDVDEEICRKNEEDGAIPVDAEFSSGDTAPPGHPNCRCVVVPVVGDDADKMTVSEHCPVHKGSFDESKHPRVPSGSANGGQFAETGADNDAATSSQHPRVSIHDNTSGGAGTGKEEIASMPYAGDDQRDAILTQAASEHPNWKSTNPEKWDMKSVKRSDAISMQKMVTTKTVEMYRKEYQANGKLARSPIAFSKGGKFYIVDGHNAAEGAYSAGAINLGMRVIPLEDDE